jgi:hypothetical protein
VIQSVSTGAAGVVAGGVERARVAYPVGVFARRRCAGRGSGIGALRARFARGESPSPELLASSGGSRSYVAVSS